MKSCYLSPCCFIYSLCLLSFIFCLLLEELGSFYDYILFLLLVYEPILFKSFFKCWWLLQGLWQTSSPYPCSPHRVGEPYTLSPLLLPLYHFFIQFTYMYVINPTIPWFVFLHISCSLCTLSFLGLQVYSFYPVLKKHLCIIFSNCFFLSIPTPLGTHPTDTRLVEIFPHSSLMIFPFSQSSVFSVFYILDNFWCSILSSLILSYL